MRGGSSLHCSRWNPNAIHKGASHYSAHIYPTNTHTHFTRSYIRRIPKNLSALRSSKRSDAWRRGTFHGVQSCIYMAANCAAMTISYEIVKSRGKFIREVRNRNDRVTHWKRLGETGELRKTASHISRIFPKIRKR